MGLANFLRKPDFGLLLMRLVLGSAMITHGLPKFMSGASTFESLGKAMAVYGITFFPLFWGFVAALTEVLGGFCIVIGLKMRYATLALAFMMLTAVFVKYKPGSFIDYAWPLEMLATFLGLTFIGPGKFSVDKD